MGPDSRLARVGLRALQSAGLLLLGLLATPMVVMLLRERSVPAPVDTQYAIIGGDTIAYHARGPRDGPVVLLVHGAATWGHVWLPVADSLAAHGWRAVAVDLPPFGWSTRRSAAGFSVTAQAVRLAALLEQLSPQAPAVLVAHSIGAAPVLQVAETAPELVATVVWVSPALGLDEERSATVPGLTARLLGVGAVRSWLLAAAALWPDGARRVLQANYGPATPPPTDNDVALLSTPFARPGSVQGWSAWAGTTLLAPPATPLAERRAAAATVRQRMLLIWGDADPVTPIGQRATLLQLWPQGETATYAGVGHFPPTEVRERLAADIAAWLGDAVR